MSDAEVPAWPEIPSPADFEADEADIDFLQFMLRRRGLPGRYDVLGWVLWVAWMGAMAVAAGLDVVSQSSYLLAALLSAVVVFLPLLSGAAGALHAGLIVETLRREGWLADLAVTKVTGKQLADCILRRVQEPQKRLMLLAYLFAMAIGLASLAACTQYRNATFLPILYPFFVIFLLIFYGITNRFLEWAINAMLSRMAPGENETSVLEWTGAWVTRAFSVQLGYTVVAFFITVLFLGMGAAGLAFVFSIPVVGILLFLIAGGIALFLLTKALDRAFSHLRELAESELETLPGDLRDWLEEA